MDLPPGMVREVEREAQQIIPSNPGHPDDVLRETAWDAVEGRFPRMPHHEKRKVVDEVVRRVSVQR